MHARFSVQLSMTIQDFGKMIYIIGNPNVVFDDFYFYANVNLAQKSRLEHFHKTGVITGLWIAEHESEYLPGGFHTHV